MTIRRFLTLLVVLVGLLSASVSPTETTQAANPFQTQPGSPENSAALEDGFSLYLPLVVRQNNRPAYGWITDRGVPVANTIVRLLFWDGMEWTTRARTQTDASGYYYFDTPELSGVQMYSVRWDNTDNGWVDTRLWQWQVNPVAATSPAGAEQCSFDLQDILFTSPPSGATVRLPYTFSWQRRLVRSDSYTFNVWSLDSDEPRFSSPRLGYTGSYRLASRPPGFQTDYVYGWDVYAYSKCGHGLSYNYWDIIFQTGSSGETVVKIGSPKQRSAGH